MTDTNSQNIWVDFVNQPGVGLERARELVITQEGLCRNEVIEDEASGNMYLRVWHMKPIDRMSEKRIEEMVLISPESIRTVKELLGPLRERCAQMAVLINMGKVSV